MSDEVRKNIIKGQVFDSSSTVAMSLFNKTKTYAFYCFLLG